MVVYRYELRFEDGGRLPLRSLRRARRYVQANGNGRAWILFTLDGRRRIGQGHGSELPPTSLPRPDPCIENAWALRHRA